MIYRYYTLVHKEGVIYTLTVIVQCNPDSIETIISFPRCIFHIDHF